MVSGPDGFRPLSATFPGSSPVASPSSSSSSSSTLRAAPGGMRGGAGPGPAPYSQLSSWFPSSSHHAGAASSPYAGTPLHHHHHHPGPYPLANLEHEPVPYASSSAAANHATLPPRATGPSGAAAAAPGPSSSSHRQAGGQASTTSPPLSSTSSSDKRTKVKGHTSSDDEIGGGGGGGNDDDDEAGAQAPSKRGKKRRRVVVACDTCRRKKVKCQGLPNRRNTCDNCENMGYTCTFTVDQDRSRGKYEILETQRDTLLAALKSVAPDLAEQFSKGDLQASLQQQQQQQQQQKQETTTDAKKRDKAKVKEAPDDDVKDPRDLGPMLPDVEDGRPRFFGGSSSLNSFHNLDSRPPSPGSGHHAPLSHLPHPPHHAGPAIAQPGPGSGSGAGTGTGSASGLQALAATASKRAGTGAGAVDAQRMHNGSSNNSAGKKWQVLPRPRPLYPSNSLAWVRLMRCKNLVAVGRDELYADQGWFERYRFPSHDLLEELLDVFFHRLMPLMPIVHGPSLRRDLAQGRANQDSAFRGLVFTILAIAARFVPPDDVRVLADADDPSSAGDHWAAASRLYHQVFAASLINVQVLLLTATFMPASLGVGTSWTVLGVAIRALQDIGLHTEKAYSEYSPFEREMRRRVFWGTFILDGILSVNLGRPTALRMADCHVHLPLLASEEALMRAEETGAPVEVLADVKQQPVVAAGFIHMIRVNMLVQDIVVTLYPVTRLQADFGHAGPTRPSYRDMTELAKRLDEWVEGIPPYLQSIRTSPFKLQAGIITCARHDIRLYIHKPFLHSGVADHSASSAAAAAAAASSSHDSVLKKMLLPTCADHARKCLETVLELHQGGHLSDMVFVFQQAFLSTATFMITVWHSTRDAARLAREDGDLVAATLLSISRLDSRFFSALLRRAQRILCGIAARMLPHLDDERRQRMSDLIKHNGGTLENASPFVFGGVASSSDPAAAAASSSTDAAMRRTQPSSGAADTGAAAPSLGSNGATVAAAPSSWTSMPEYAVSGAPSAFAAAAEANPAPPSTSSGSAAQHDDTASSTLLEPNFDSLDSGGGGGGGGGDFASPADASSLLLPSHEVLPSGAPFSALGLETVSDLTWTGYFHRFLGGLLPEPAMHAGDVHAVGSQASPLPHPHQPSWSSQGSGHGNGSGSTPQAQTTPSNPWSGLTPASSPGFIARAHTHAHAHAHQH